MTHLVVDEAIAGKGLVAAFQPVVSLPSRRIVGYEALARWPAFSGFTPAQALLYAQETNQLSVLDKACIKSAVCGALLGKTTPGMLLLINCEPGTTQIPFSDDRDFMRAADRFRITFEFTERGLLVNPRSLLSKIDALRSMGCRIALDDVGAHPDSLALLDIVRPDFIKLDMTLVQQHPGPRQMRTVAAIIDHQERTGAVICAEGIENDEHLERAMAFGATLGQGNSLGAPGELAADVEMSPWLDLTANEVDKRQPTASCRELIGGTPRKVRQRTLEEYVKHIQHMSLTAGSAPIVLASFGEDRPWDRAILENFSRLAEKSPLVAIYGKAPPTGLSSDVRWVDTGGDDQFADLAFVVALGPEVSAGLMACRRPKSPTMSEEQFAMLITFDRNRIQAVATKLLNRFARL